MNQTQKTFFTSFDRVSGRTFKRSYPQYWPDGFGRDVYIRYDNAGIWKDNIKPIEKKTEFEIPKYSNFHSLRRIPPIWKYKVDGTGRDSYVNIDYGGLVNFFTPAAVTRKYFFKRSDLSPRPKPSIKYYKLSKAEEITQDHLREIQKGVTNRLYYSNFQKNKPNRKLYITNENPQFNDSKKMIRSSSCDDILPKITKYKTSLDDFQYKKYLFKNFRILES